MEIKELEEKLISLENRVSNLEKINKNNKIKKRIYYSVLFILSLVIVVAAYFIFKNTYGEIIKYLH